MTKNRHLGTIAQLCWAVSLQLRHRAPVSTIYTPSRQPLRVSLRGVLTKSWWSTSVGPWHERIAAGSTVTCRSPVRRRATTDGKFSTRARRRCTWRRPSEDTGSAWCGRGRSWSDRHKTSTANKAIKLAATLRWFTTGGAIRIAVRQLSQTWKLRHYDVITRKL